MHAAFKCGGVATSVGTSDFKLSNLLNSGVGEVHGSDEGPFGYFKGRGFFSVKVLGKSSAG